MKKLAAYLPADSTDPQDFGVIDLTNPPAQPPQVFFLDVPDAEAPAAARPVRKDSDGNWISQDGRIWSRTPI